MDMIKKRVEEVLSRGHVMSLATLDAEGVWVADVIFIYDDTFTLYWMSDPETRHSTAILQNSGIAGTITISNKSKEPNLGIQFSGKAEKIEGNRYDLAKKHFAKRSHPEPKETDDVLQGDSWYKIVPTKIKLIDEENFGWDRQTFL